MTPIFLHTLFLLDFRNDDLVLDLVKDFGQGHIDHGHEVVVVADRGQSSHIISPPPWRKICFSGGLTNLRVRHCGL